MNFYDFLLIIFVLCLLFAAYILYKSSLKHFSKRDLVFFKTEWQKVYANNDKKHAVLDADKLLSLALKKRGYQGTVGDQLKKAGKLFTNINDVWSAHKLRNQIAHELNFNLSHPDNQRALRSFERALKDLGAL